MFVITVLSIVLGAGSIVYRRAASQRHWLSVLQSLYGNEPWVAIRYHGYAEFEDPLRRPLLFDAIVPVEELKLFTTFATDDALESIPEDSPVSALALIDTDISDRGFIAITYLRSLETLTITDTDISADALSMLLSKPSLRRLHFKACRKNDENEDDTALPRCRPEIEVVWD